MIWIILFIVMLVLIGISLFFVLRKPGVPGTPSMFDPLFPSQKCTPKLDEIDAYAATYIKDSDDKCVADTCKPGYSFYYSDPKSINKFKRCQ
jgi:hypothetical protein